VLDFEKLCKSANLVVAQPNENGQEICELLDPLPIWKSLEGSFPILSRLARRYLAIPESNSFQERVFSCASFLQSKLRLSAKYETVERNTLLRVNGATMAELTKVQEEWWREMSSSGRLEKAVAASMSSNAEALIDAIRETDDGVVDLVVPPPPTKKQRTM
jgi:hypothetical protein